MRTKRGLALILVGLLLIAAALGLTAYNLLDNQRVKHQSATVFEALIAVLERRAAETGQVRGDEEGPVWETDGQSPGETQNSIHPGGTQTHEGQARPETPQEEDVTLPDYELNPEIPMPEAVIDGYTYIALLRIPALGLELPVMGDWSYEQLRSAPCRYVGSIYNDTLVVMAHNYDSHFGRLYTLGYGDEVTLTDMHGNVFRYRVTEQEVLDGDDAEPIIYSDWDLTLFTCTIGGLNRVTVRCERI